jgi:NADPH-dependent curcumin reductase CurA
MDDRKSYAKTPQLGAVMTGEPVARAIASNRSEYSEGDLVPAPTGWCKHALSDGAGLRKLDSTFASVTTGPGVLGMPGFTEYGGLRLAGLLRRNYRVVEVVVHFPRLGYGVQTIR